MSSDDNRPGHENFLSKHGPFIVYVVILAILIDNLLKLGFLAEVKWQHIALIGGLLLIPFFREVDRVFVPNVGGFQMNQTKEWKSTMQEVLEEANSEAISESVEQEEDGAPEKEKQGDDVESDEEDHQEEDSDEDREETHGDDSEEAIRNKIGPNQENVERLGGSVDEIAEELYSLADNNPRLAISKLGMELEHGLRHLINSRDMTPEMQYHDMLRQLRDVPDIDSRFINIAEEIRHARNEAVHSAEFNMENTAGLIDIGLDLLRYINKSTRTEKIPEEAPPTRHR